MPQCSRVAHVASQFGAYTGMCNASKQLTLACSPTIRSIYSKVQMPKAELQVG